LGECGAFATQPKDSLLATKKEGKTPNVRKQKNGRRERGGVARKGGNASPSP